MAEKELTIKTTEVERAIGELMFLALLVDQRTDYIVFIDYSAHVEKLDFSIRRSKKEYEEVIADGSIYTDEDFHIDRANRIKEIFIQILDDKEIDYDNLMYDIEEIYHYKF